MHTSIRRLVEDDVHGVVAFAVSAWAPVFASFEAELGPVYRLLFPDWRATQGAAVEAVCRGADNDVWVATADGRPVGFVAVSYVEEAAAQAGEVTMIAVDPAHQRAGIGAALMHRAVGEIERRGLDLAVVATGGDPGHAPARALYERFSFKALPQVRYYRKL